MDELSKEHAAIVALRCGVPLWQVAPVGADTDLGQKYVCVPVEVVKKILEDETQGGEYAQKLW